MSLVNSLIGGFAKSVVLGQVRTWLPAVGGGLTTLGVTSQVNAQTFEGSLYYIVSSLFVVVPAVFSYLQKKSVQSLVTSAIAAAPGTPEATAIEAKVS